MNDSFRTKALFSLSGCISIIIGKLEYLLCSLLEENWEQKDKDSLPYGVYLNQFFFHETKTHSRKKWIL